MTYERCAQLVNLRPPQATKLHWNQNVALLQPRYNKLQKMNLARSQKMEPPGGPILGPHAPLTGKKQKKSTFHGLSFGTIWRYQKIRPQKSQNKHSKGRPVQRTKMTNASEKHIDLEQRRPALAKPDFNCLSGPRSGTWKRTCVVPCSNTAIAMQHHPGTFTNPSLLRFFSVQRLGIRQVVQHVQLHVWQKQTKRRTKTQSHKMPYRCVSEATQHRGKQGSLHPAPRSHTVDPQ